MAVALLSLLLAAGSAYALSPTDVCHLVDSKIPGKIFLPGSSTYDSSIASYYGAPERDLKPACIFRPTATADVSQFVKIATSPDSPVNFAVRGGGHTFWPGAANIQAGITIDMRAMNNVELSSDRKIARVGGGALWDQVYPQLVPYNLPVMGGRIPGIGVGGFATGAGITFTSRHHGFSADNIFGYEVVLGSGKVVYADAGSNADLWLAMKSGSNNLGIITRFDIATISQGKMWYSLLSYNYTKTNLQANAQAFNDFMKPQNFDDAAMMGMFLDYAGGNLSLANIMWYTDAVDNPPVYNRFTQIPNLGGPAELTTVDKVVEDFGKYIPTTEDRGYQLTYSFQNPSSPTVYTQLFSTWQSALSPIAQVPGLFIEFLLQPHPVTNGTNLFGLEPHKTDLVMVDMTAAWSNASDDPKVKSTIDSIVKQQQAVLQQNKLGVDFIYLNYADASQKVYQSWGEGNVAKLKAASQKYDPKAVFQKQVPGGFKIPA